MIDSKSGSGKNESSVSSGIPSSPSQGRLKIRSSVKTNAQAEAGLASAVTPAGMSTSSFEVIGTPPPQMAGARSAESIVYGDEDFP